MSVGLFQLVATPFLSSHQPALGVSLLAAVLKSHGYPAAISYLNIDFGRRVGWDFSRFVENRFSGDLLLGEMIFARALWGGAAPSWQAYRKHLTQTWKTRLYARDSVLADEYIDKIGDLYDKSPQVITRWAADLLSNKPRVVGFTSSFQQNIASLALAKHIRLQVSPHETTIIFGGANCEAEMGHAIAENFPFVDHVVSGEGERAIVDIARQAYDRSTEIYYLLGLMEEKGIIVERLGSLDPARATFWFELGLDAAGAERRLQKTPVELIGIAEAHRDVFGHALAALGVRVGKPGELAIVIADDYFDPRLETINRSAMLSGRPWLPVKLGGTSIWIGPLVRPGITACWTCLSHRLHGNLKLRSHLRRSVVAYRSATSARPSAIMAMSALLAATEVVKAIARESEDHSAAHILSIDIRTFKTVRHAVVRRPQCPCCGEGHDGPGLPLVLESRPKRTYSEGRHGTMSAAETCATYGHHVSPLSGLVDSLVRVDLDGCNSLHVYVAGYNFALSSDSLAKSRPGLRTQSSGKGTTDAQARASALCEALERYSGVYQGDERRRRASFRELADEAVRPSTCLHFSQRQYARRTEWNSRGSPFTRVPEPFDETASVDWTPAWSLTESRVKYLLTPYCYYGYRAESSDQQYCWADSNGNAAGATIEEAILHGFMELVERDAVALWWYSRARRPGVDLDGLDQPYLRAVRCDYERNGRDLWVLDLTSDLGIPVFAAVSCRRDRPEQQILFGFGAHFDPLVSIQRAVSELHQVLVRAHGVSTGSFRPGFDHTDFGNWWRTATIAQHPYLAPDTSAPAIAHHNRPKAWSEDVRDDLLKCRAIVERHGMEMLVLDQTRPDIKLPVVKVIVPGLRHFWARFAPGRLFDAPPRLGWIEGALSEDELNPIPIFL